MGQTMKTTRQWFEQALSEGYEWAEQALKNMDIDEPEFYLSDALFNGFDWPDSPQGEAYWAEIHDNLFERGL